MSYRPTCDACGIEVYPVIHRTQGGCCCDCRDRIEEMKKRMKEKEESK